MSAACECGPAPPAACPRTRSTPPRSTAPLACPLPLHRASQTAPAQKRAELLEEVGEVYGTLLVTCGPGALFGELALLYAQARAASAIVLEPSEVRAAARRLPAFPAHHWLPLRACLQA